MNLKLPVLAFSLVTAAAGTAAAHENCNGHAHGPAPAGYGAPGNYGNHGNPGYGKPGYGGPGGYRNNGRGVGYMRAAHELRDSDLNRDGWVTLGEAMDHGRRDFYWSDTDRNHVLSRRELSRAELEHADRNRDGVVTYREHESAIRRRFARFDDNRDGYLAGYELDGRGAPPARTAGWWR